MEQRKKLTAPIVNHYIECLGRINYRLYNNDTTYDKESYKLIEQFYERIKYIQAEVKHGYRAWRLWFHADRGPIEDFADYDEWLDAGSIENREQFEKAWLDFFPDEEEWYEISVGEDIKTHYRWIVARHRQVIEVDPEKAHLSFEFDIHEFIQWLIDSLEECIVQLHEGRYNKIVNDRLPPQHRVGTIVRKDFWGIFPELRDEFFKDISANDVQRAITAISKQPQLDDFSERVSVMTANEFYRICALGYAANNYNYTDQSPKYQYERHADGRDEGLGEIDADSPTAFHDWLKRKDRGGGHPWEVCRGGNSTHVSLMAMYDTRGYYFFLAGSAVGRTVETIKFFLALKDAGIPVFIEDAEELVARLKGEERIGIVPDGVIPKYCSNWFPGERIIAYMNLPYEERAQIVPLVTWQELDQVSLTTEVTE